jgi:hypothetical protein
VLTDGHEADRPSILPAPGELEVGDPSQLRLKRLASLGLGLLGPVSPETDETRLAFAYLADDPAEAIRVLDRLRQTVDDPARLRDLRLLEAQIALQQKHFDQAETLLEDLRRRSPSRYELDELPEGRFLMQKQPDPTAQWVRFLREKAAALKAPTTREDGDDLVPRNVLDLERLRPLPPPQAPQPNGLPF